MATIILSGFWVGLFSSMDKAEASAALKSLLSQKLLTKEEVLQTYQESVGEEIGAKIQRVNFSHILFLIGGAIVFIGIAIFVGQNWDKHGPLTKILATLGSSIAAYWIGVLFSQYEEFDWTAQAFFFISALVMPFGLFVTFDKAGLDVGSNAIQTLITGILLLLYLTSYFVFRKKIFVVFDIIIDYR